MADNLDDKTLSGNSDSASASGDDQGAEESYDVPPAGHQQKSIACPCSRPIKHDGWFIEEMIVQSKEKKKVKFKERENNVVMPLPSGKLIFEAIAKAIEGAKKSVDIVTMGFESDFRLIRTDEKLKNRVLGGYEWPCYPAIPKDPCYRTGQKGDPSFIDAYTKGKAPSEPPSYVLADLLTWAAHKGTRISILASEPRDLINTFYDPLHFWWRCKSRSKDELYENITFAVRKFTGVNISPPGKEPKIDDSKMSGSEKRSHFGTKVADFFAGIAKWSPKFYRAIHAHHQKIVLIDSELAEAKAFIIGSNINEEYWDDGDHAGYNPLRVPYKPWHDAGLWVQGPVVRDIAQNIKDSWKLMIETESEASPDSLIAEGMLAEKEGRLNKSAGSGRGCYGGSSTRPTEDSGFDFKRYKTIADSVSPIMSGFNFADNDATRLLAVCAALTNVIDLAGGMLSGTLTFRDSAAPKVKVAPKITILSNPVDYKAPLDKSEDGTKPRVTLTAQFSRTFNHKYKDTDSDKDSDISLDASLVAAVYNAVRNVQCGGLIYIENQYFRDLRFVEELKKLNVGYTSEECRTKCQETGCLNPYVIIITSATELNPAEKMVSLGPTFLTYQNLRSAGLNFLFCRLRTKEYNPQWPNNEYLEPRHNYSKMEIFTNAILPILKNCLFFSSLAVGLIRGETLRIRDALWAALPFIADKHLHKKFTPGPGRYLPDQEDSRKKMEENQKVFDKALHDIENLVNVLGAVDDPDSALYGLLKRIKDNHNDNQAFKELAGMVTGDPNGVPAGLAENYKFFKDYDPLGETVRNKMREEAEKNENMSNQGIVAPPAEGDKGGIYLHSKVMIIDQAFATLGSANHNERSMWHDTEDMLGVRSFTKDDFPGKLRKELIKIALSGKYPDDDSAENIFARFKIQMTNNSEMYFDGQDQQSLIFPYVPASKWGSFKIA